eukprot:13561-Heterococcus_DN1.PRE.5
MAQRLSAIPRTQYTSDSCCYMCLCITSSSSVAQTVFIASSSSVSQTTCQLNVDSRQIVQSAGKCGHLVIPCCSCDLVVSVTGAFHPTQGAPLDLLLLLVPTCAMTSTIYATACCC